MRLTRCCVLLGACLAVSLPCFADMVITGVIDGPLTGGEPKAIELCVLNNILDLSIYGVGSANNGGGSDGEEFTFPAVAASAGDFIHVSYDSANFHTFFGFPPDYFSVGAANINGDDAIELFKEGEVIDVFGDINASGYGTSWEYTDGWAYRNDNTGPDGSFFQISHWTFSGSGVLDKNDDPTNDEAEPRFPIGTYSSDAIAIDLISFTATQHNNTILLEWQTAAEINCAGFFLHRSPVEEEKYECVTLQMIPSQPEHCNGHTYSFMDNPPFMSAFDYKLEEIALDGQRTFYGPVSTQISTSVSSQPLPTNIQLVQAWPNPFNAGTTFEFTLESSGFVEVMIYNAAGKRIRTLEQNLFAAGIYQIPWNGKTDQGEAAPSGLYFASINTEHWRQTLKLTLLR